MLQKFQRDDKLLQPLKELFRSSSADEKDDKMMLWREAYYNYKRKYVRHLSFNAGEQHSSKVISIY